MEIQWSEIPLFREVESNELDRLFSSILFQRRSFPPGSLVVSQGEECNRLMILTEGMVKGEMISPDGKSLKIEDMEAPSILASAFLFGRKNFFPVNITSVTEVKFIVIPRGELLKLFQMNQQILQNFLAMISSRAQFLSDKLRFHSFKSLKAKLAYFLVNEAGKANSFKLRHSQQELAELFGVARPSVGRAFLILQEEGIIDIRYRQVEILDRKKLNEACNE
ncbi:MAG TPA: Crp/Fnr family transcriptional regulator [Prolixibacteraceae bacterium]|nr:Crp/Fnr family transcriptional regulator [Prolixibacteraceae bacterium]HPS12440.1 Crp/Fnr family transcriptional regulator [Prolixibacteraceae bacterium]